MRILPTHGLWTTFRIPLLVGALSLAGLVGALLDDGPWDVLGAALLAVSLAAAAWGRFRRPHRRG